MSCEAYEIELSSFLDGELAPEAAAAAVEHALGCADCAGFFHAARRVQSAAAGLRATDGELDELRAERLWRDVEARAAKTPAAAPRRGAALRAAALVALGLGGGYLFALLGGPAATTALAGGGTTVFASTRPADGMNEKRFVALADELLSSDVRYQRAMLEVLRLVPALESGEGLRSEDEPRVVRASNDERPGRGAI